MYLAHAGVALGAKRADQRLPLSWYLAGAWAYDLTGVGHWAPVAVLIAVLAYWLGSRRRDAKAGAVLAAAVISHDMLDLVVGLQLLPRGDFIGWNLDITSRIEFGLEFAFIVGGWLLYRSSLRPAARRRPGMYMPLMLLVLVSAVNFWLTEPVAVDDHSPTPMRVVLLGLGIAGTWAALVWADRRAGRPSVEQVR